MKYPNDFTPFRGVKLSDVEIDVLIQNAWDDYGSEKASEFCEPLGSVSTGDTMVVVEEFGHIIVWKQVAEIWIEEVKG